ncbi:MAG: hypothetical protein RSD40_00360 [Bacilli bacterium]
MRKLLNCLKINICCYFLLASGKIYSQVGVNNTSPNATFDVSAQADDTTKTDGIIAPRLTGTQLKNKDNLYTGLQDGAIVYVTEPLTSGQTTDRTINVLEKGYYGFNSSLGTVGQWTPMFNINPIIVEGATVSPRLQISEVTLSTSGTNQANIYSKTFTLVRKSLVHFNFSVPANNVVRANGQLLTDGTSKLFGVNDRLHKTTAPTYSNQNIIRDTEVFSNSGNNQAIGIFQLGGNRQLVLDPGTYRIELAAFVYAHQNDASGVRVTFGTNETGSTELRSVVDIIATPLDK